MGNRVSRPNGQSSYDSMHLFALHAEAFTPVLLASLQHQTSDIIDTLQLTVSIPSSLPW